MNRVAPAIIPNSLDHLREELSRIRPFTREVQVDLVDGILVPFSSWPYRPLGEPEELSIVTPLFDIELDLMVMRPEEVIPRYSKVGVRSVVVHVEGTKELPRILEQRERLGFRLGLSIENDSPLAFLTPHLPHIDYVQLMGIARIGSQGQPFDTRVLSRIRELKILKPDLWVSIDGSVNEETIHELVAAGADRCVSGSAILKADDPETAWKKLSSAWVL